MELLLIKIELVYQLLLPIQLTIECILRIIGLHQLMLLFCQVIYLFLQLALCFFEWFTFLIVFLSLILKLLVVQISIFPHLRLIILNRLYLLPRFNQFLVDSFTFLLVVIQFFYFTFELLFMQLSLTGHFLHVFLLLGH